MTRAELLQKITTDLAWRGPSNRPARYVVIERDDAALLLDPTDRGELLGEILRLVLVLAAAMPEGERPGHAKL